MHADKTFKALQCTALLFLCLCLFLSFRFSLSFSHSQFILHALSLPLVCFSPSFPLSFIPLSFLSPFQPTTSLAPHFLPYISLFIHLSLTLFYFLSPLLSASVERLETRGNVAMATPASQSHLGCKWPRILLAHNFKIPTFPPSTLLLFSRSLSLSLYHSHPFVFLVLSSS